MSYVPRSVLVAWVGLVSATVLSWWVGAGHSSVGSSVGGVAVIVVAFVKVRFVCAYFMDLRVAPAALARAVDLYLVCMTALLVAMFLIH